MFNEFSFEINEFFNKLFNFPIISVQCDTNMNIFSFKCSNHKSSVAPPAVATQHQSIKHSQLTQSVMLCLNTLYEKCVLLSSSRCIGVCVFVSERVIQPKHTVCHQYNRTRRTKITKINRMEEEVEEEKKKEQNKYVVCYLCDFCKVEETKVIAVVCLHFSHIHIVNKRVFAICILEIGLKSELRKIVLVQNDENWLKIVRS